MDVTLAKTFLEVAATGNFVAAARRLHVTQSTVSTRIRTLEVQLGTDLFSRGKSGVALTPAGEQFQPYATTMVRIWQQARHDISLPPGYRAMLVVGGETSLWDELLLDWLGWMNGHVTDVAIRAERGSSETLMGRLVDGTLDIGVMHTPQQRPGLRVERLFESELVMVATTPVDAVDRIREVDYVYVDWGQEFRAYHSSCHPQLSNPRLYVDSGFIGLQHIVNNGGAGYFPARVVAGHEQSRKVYRVPGVSAFTLPAYAVHPADAQRSEIAMAIDGLKRLATRPPVDDDPGAGGSG